MNKKQLVLAVALAVLAGFTASVQAIVIPVTGSVVIQGGTTLTPVGAPLGTATGVAATTGSVLAGSGSFTGTAGSAVTFNAFTFQPVTTPVISLWSFAAGGLAYNFDLTGMTVHTYNSSFLDISGTGTLSITGYTPTPGTWTYQINSTDPAGVNGVFSYQSSNSAVPDGGMTLVLLGAVLSGIYMVRPKTVS